MYVIFAAAVFVTCSQPHVVDVLAVAILGTCLLPQQQQRSRSVFFLSNFFANNNN